jgi:predicted PurR-regulated permease PerM
MTTSLEPGPPAEGAFLRRVVWLLLAVLVAAALAALLVLGIEIALVAFGGVLLAVLLSALTDLLARALPFGRSFAYGVVLVLIVVLLGAATAFLVPRVSAQVQELQEELPRMWGEVERFLARQSWGHWVSEKLSGEELAETVDERAGAVFGGLTHAFTLFVTLVFTALFGAANPRLYQEGIVRLFVLPRRARVREVVGELSHALRWWLIGRAFAMALVGASTALVLLLLDVRFATLLGIVAGLLTFIPYLGPVAAAVPILLVASVHGSQTVLYALLAYTVVQLIEGYVLDPVLMHRLVYIPPVVTIVLQVLFGVVIGVVGIAMATPFAAVLVVLVRVYRQDLLGEPKEGVTA